MKSVFYSIMTIPYDAMQDDANPMIYTYTFPSTRYHQQISYNSSLILSPPSFSPTAPPSSLSPSTPPLPSSHFLLIAAISSSYLVHSGTCLLARSSLGSLVSG